MLRGYRCVLIAALGVALVGAAPSQGKGDNGHKPSSQSEIRSGLDNVAAAIENTHQPEAPNPACAPGQDNHTSDLCAQWKAADAAAESALWTARAFWLGFVGAFIGAATLAAAIYAAVYAKGAVEAADRQLAENDRPHILAETVMIGPIDPVRPLFLPVSVQWKNHGGSPAFIRKVRIQPYFGKTCPEPVLGIGGAWMDVMLPLAPGGQSGFGVDGNFGFQVKPRLSVVLYAKKRMTYLFIEARYQDGAGGWHDSKAVWRTMPGAYPPQAHPHSFWEYT